VDAAARLTRRGAALEPSFEAIDVRTIDAWSLRANVLEPGGDARGVAVLAHALAVDKSAFDRPRGAGLARFLARRGWCAVAFDFRGHGESQRLRGAGRCDYDRLVERDFPAVCDFARFRAGGLPVVVIGHGLGGHAALAAVGASSMDVDAVVALGTTVWIPALEPSRARTWARRAIAEGVALAASSAGRLPAASRALRLLGLGDDGVRAVASDLARFACDGRWESADGGRDYLASLAAVRVPVLDVVSEGDAFACPPVCGERLVARCGGRREVFRVCRGDAGTRPPSAMGLVTSGRVQRVWACIEDWMRAVTASRSVSS
jgi:predicted alpha/beta hydrolase